jgi:hypothetical protein
MKTYLEALIQNRTPRPAAQTYIVTQRERKSKKAYGGTPVETFASRYNSALYREIFDGEDEYLRCLFSLDMTIHSEFRPLARLGDKEIGLVIREFDNKSISWRGSNAYFVCMLRPYWISMRSVHNQGDQIEAAYALANDHGKAWFLGMIGITDPLTYIDIIRYHH